MQKGGGCVDSKLGDATYGQYFKGGRKRLNAVLPTMFEYIEAARGADTELLEATEKVLMKSFKKFLPYFINFQCRCTSNMDTYALEVYNSFTSVDNTLECGTNTLTGIDILTGMVNCPNAYRDLFIEFLDNNFDSFVGLACERTRTSGSLIPGDENTCRIKTNKAGNKFKLKCKKGYCFSSTLM